MSLDLRSTVPCYILTIPPQAVGASKVHCDLFNGLASGVSLRVLSASARASMDAAVTGVLAASVALTRTTEAGSGGTSAVTAGTNPAAPSIARINLADIALPEDITARAAPAAGATAGAVLSLRHVFTEETNAGTSTSNAIGTQHVPPERPIIVPQGSGLRFVQGSVATVGSLFFEIVFELVQP